MTDFLLRLRKSVGKVNSTKDVFFIFHISIVCPEFKRGWIVLNFQLSGWYYIIRLNKVEKIHFCQNTYSYLKKIVVHQKKSRQQKEDIGLKF